MSELIRLGLQQEANGKTEEALVLLKRAIEMNPCEPEAYYYLGTLELRLQQYAQAEASFREALRLRPDYSAAYNNFGLVLRETNRLEEAAAQFSQAITLKPDYAEALNNLGVVQVLTNQPAAAAASLIRAIELKPDYAEAYNNLGLVLKGAGRFREAEEYFLYAIQFRKDYPEAYNNLGTTLTDANREEEAIICFCHALSLRPDSGQVYHNLGVVLTNTNRLEQAEICFLKALALVPNFTEAEFSLALLYLLQGKYEAGWEKYDKSRIVHYSEPQPTQPRWQGERLSGRRILLYYEQGFGDTFQFLRYAREVAALAAETVLWVQDSLGRLVANSFPPLKVYCGGEPPSNHFDFSCPLPSLPRIFKTTEKTIPQAVPYIKPPAKLVAKWQRKLAALKHQGLSIGILWAGNPLHHNDRNRSIPFITFSRLLSAGEVRWISLQVGARAQETANHSLVADFSPELVDFAETAALIANLDLIITVDSAVAHLAGAMGKATWLLLPFAPDWRWQLAREDSSWYPTMRLFRQEQAGDWDGVLERVKKTLCREVIK
jgi:Flp pilus assembly protein TadD